MYASNCIVSIIFNYFRFISEDLTHIKLHLSTQILWLSSQSEILFNGEMQTPFFAGSDDISLMEDIKYLAVNIDIELLLL